MKKKVITFAVNQQRPMVVQNASEAKAHQPRAPVKCPENKPQKSRQRPRTRRSSSFRTPVSQPKLDTASAKQFIEKQVAVPLPPCYFCGGKHTLCRCSDFFFLRLAEREDFVQQMKLCVNCFSQRHNASSCRDKPRCLRCPQWHHTLLHRNV
ncbi:uncharacterized protein LOC120420669 [Culex pipiens pallens]|uniref:uncharacterized protein LOC120420669 n=1 Tax=Culex pipiens pallens TaxID=42434 RepID=UPI0019538578|nr:uncharacterized protein LOC120420669 [Culex pipiens pallens]